MDLDFDEATEEFRAEVRDFLEANKRSFPTSGWARWAARSWWPGPAQSSTSNR